MRALWKLSKMAVLIGAGMYLMKAWESYSAKEREMGHAEGITDKEHEHEGGKSGKKL